MSSKVIRDAISSCCSSEGAAFFFNDSDNLFLVNTGSDPVIESDPGKDTGVVAASDNKVVGTVCNSVLVFDL